MNKAPFLSTIYTGPHNEYVEEFRGDELHGRILYNGLEVATLRYTEDYRWGQLYAAAPALLEACKAAWDAANVANPRRDCTAAEFEAMRMIREAIAQAEAQS